MIDTIKTILQIKAATNVNRFIYFFKRIWLIGNIMPDSIYEDETLKNALSVVVSVFVQIYKFLSKIYYLATVVIFPVWLAYEINGNLNGDEFYLSIHILFIMNCILGSILDSQIFTVNQNKYICIKYMHMDPKKYIMAAILMKYVPFYLYYLIVFLIAGSLTGGAIHEIVFFWLTFICFRLMGEALQLWLYDKKGFVLSRRNILLFSIIPFALAAAYAPMLFGFTNTIAPFLLHPVSVLVILAIGGFCLYYIVWGYPFYRTKIPRTLDEKLLFSVAAKQSPQKNFADVAIKDKDLENVDQIGNRYSSLKGYPYLNALFFSRHRRLLVKPIYYRLLAISMTLSLGIIIYLFNRELAVTISEKITDFLPVFVFIMYIITVASKACRAMFYNCDISLLRYGFYRKPQTILNNFNIRLLRISLYNEVIGAAICIAIIIFKILCGTDWFTIDMLIFAGAILLLSIFFTVHHLFMYYVFQPYTTELNVKNPFFNVINGIVYFLSYLCLQIEAGGAPLTITILIFTIVYITVALFLVYRLAPRNFRVK